MSTERADTEGQPKPRPRPAGLLSPKALLDMATPQEDDEEDWHRPKEKG